MINRISAINAARNFSDLINRVHYQGTSFEIERGNEVIARIIPAAPASVLGDFRQIVYQLLEVSL